MSDFEDKTLLILDDDPLELNLQELWKRKVFMIKAKTVAEGLNIVKNTPSACVILTRGRKWTRRC